MSITPAVTTAWLGLGSNIGSDEEKTAVLRTVTVELERAASGQLRVTGMSSIYRTPPWGVTDQPDFFNAVLRAETTLTPQELLRTAKEVEQALGRRPTYRWGPRVIDIDLLLMDDVTITTPELTLPHPGLLRRAFVTVPLLELTPDLRLPDGRLLRDAAPTDTSGVLKTVPPQSPDSAPSI